MDRHRLLRRFAAASGLLGALVYLGALANGFAYDDLVLITGDPGIRSLEGLWTRLGEPSWPGSFGADVGAWRPLTTGTWAAVWALAGESAFAFHLLGVILHAACSTLVVLAFAELVPLAVAGLTGLLFAVHPVHSEAVANVVGSAEPLSALFALLALVVHLRGERSYGPGRVLGVTVLYGLAVLAKEGAAVLPLVLLIVDEARWGTPLTGVGRYLRARLLLFASMAAVLALILLLRADVVGAVTGATYPPGGEVLMDAPRVWTVFSTWVEYLRLLFFPLALSPDYGPGIVPVAFGWTVRAGLGAGLGLCAFVTALLVWRSTPELRVDHVTDRTPALGLLWIAAALLPVSNVLYLGPVFVAERTLYLASAGACVIVAWLLVRLGEDRGRLTWVAGAFLLAAASGRTIVRVPEWADTDTVMAALIEDHPESGTGWLALGGRLAREGRQPEALRAHAWGVAFQNSEYAPSTQVATQLLTMGRIDAARFFLRRAWRDHPAWYSAPGLLAAAELNAGRNVEAAAAARAATILEPGDPSMHQLLAQALGLQGLWAEAANARRASIEAGFRDRGSSWLLLARDRLRAGQSLEAAAALDSAALRPLDEGELETHAELTALLPDTGGD